MAAKVWCFKCKSWVDKEDYHQPNSDALAAHESRCAANLAGTMFGEHPDLAELATELEKIGHLYG